MTQRFAAEVVPLFETGALRAVIDEATGWSRRATPTAAWRRTRTSARSCSTSAGPERPEPGNGPGGQLGVGHGASGRSPSSQAASGIGFALAERFASAGLAVVLADVEEGAPCAAAEKVGAAGVETLAVRTDVSQEGDVAALAEPRRNASAASTSSATTQESSPAATPGSDPVLLGGGDGRQLLGRRARVRTFLPMLIARGGGHIVNTASIEGLYPGFSGQYDASKHAVVAVSPRGSTRCCRRLGCRSGSASPVSRLVRTSTDAERNWPRAARHLPEPSPLAAVTEQHVRRAIDEDDARAVADHVLDAIAEDQFWIFPHDDFLDVVVERWCTRSRRSATRNPSRIPGDAPAKSSSPRCRRRWRRRPRMARRVSSSGVAGSRSPRSGADAEHLVHGDTGGLEVDRARGHVEAPDSGPAGPASATASSH